MIRVQELYGANTLVFYVQITKLIRKAFLVRSWCTIEVPCEISNVLSLEYRILRKTSLKFECSYKSMGDSSLLNILQMLKQTEYYSLDVF